MKDFTNLLNSIDEIEDNFVIINTRIIEFWKSTNYEHIDFWLLDKYFDVLTDYISFLNEQKNEIKSNLSKSDIEYQAYKKLTDIRINWLIKKLELNIKKISKIIKIKPKKQKIEKKDDIFISSLQMDTIDKLTEEFDLEYNLFKTYQKEIWFLIKLDDKVEKQIEIENTYEDMLMIEKSFINDYINIFEKILEAKSIRFKEIWLRKYNVFTSLKDYKNYNELFFKIFQKEYIVLLETLNENFSIDYKWFKIFISELDFLFDIADFCSDFEKLLKNSKKYDLENHIIKFQNIKILLEQNILNNDIFNLDRDLLYIKKKFWISKIKVMIDYFKDFEILLDNLDKFSKISFVWVDKYYNSWFIEFFKSDINWKKIIQQFLKEFSIYITNDIKNNNINIKNIDKNADIFELYIDKLKLIYNWIKLNNTAITNFTYSSTGLKNIRNTIKKNLYEYNNYLYINKLLVYYNQSATKVYNKKRSEYIAVQAAAKAAASTASYRPSSSRSSSSSSNSYSSSSSWSSSSWSSSSSNYSSSGSSSW